MRATAHTLSGFSPAHHDLPRVHARPSRRTCDERVARAPSRQHRGNAAAPTRTDTNSSASQRPRWKHADCGQLSTERRREVASRGSQHAGRGAERGGKGRRLTCACRALRPSLWAVRWKEGAVAAVRRPRLRASWAAAMGTLLGTRRSRGLPKRGAAAGETGARIGGARAAGSGVAKPPSQPMPEPEEAGIWGARSSGRCAPFTSAPVAGASSTSPCRRAGQRDHRPRQAPR
eukprot:COSAG04_NODE_2241_length_4466_cov_20.608198_5_plen_232_part_00